MKVVYAANELGLGGTEKAMVTHALALGEGEADVSVVAIHREGLRREVVERAGIDVACARGDLGELTELLRGADVVHVFRGGFAEPLLPAAARAAGVAHLVESNVFGAVDASDDASRFDCHLVPSKFCAMRLRNRLGLSRPEFNRRYRVSHWPVNVAGLREIAPSSQEAKERLGLDPERPVVARVGRADDRKWRDLLVDMVPVLLDLVPEVQVALVGATPARLRRLEAAGVLDRVDLIPPTGSEPELATMYAACDAFVTAAEIGESHSFAIEEAMTLGAPVVTCSTPWVDNAQIEQVDEGVTGHIADHPRPFAEAVASIVTDGAKRDAFSAAAAEKAERLYDARELTLQLERLYGALLDHGAPPEEWSPAVTEVDDFDAEYQRRLSARFRPLTPEEAREERAGRVRERARWAARAVRSNLNPEGLRTVWWTLRSRL